MENTKDDNINEKLKKIKNEQEKLFDSISDLLPKLQQIEANLTEVNNMTGATKRAEDVREEIKLKGWPTIERIYKPTENSNQLTIALWNFYEFIHSDMVKKGEIK